MRLLLVNFWAQIRSRWNSWTRDQKIAVIGLLIAFPGLIVLIPDSPEKQLADLGYHITHDDFWRAISNKHVEAVKLFTKTSVRRLEPDDFILLFNGRTFDTDIFKILEKARSIDEKFCPTTKEFIRIYSLVSPSTEKLQAIRRVCNKSAVILTIESTGKEETERLQALNKQNQSRDLRIRDCISRYENEDMNSLLEEASRFSIFSSNSYSEREYLLAKLNAELLLGAQRLMDSNQGLLEIIKETCMKYNPMKELDSETLHDIREAISILRNGET